MKSMHRISSVFLIMLVLAATPAAAQDFPSKPVRIIIAYGAGSGLDGLTRQTAQDLNAMWNQPVIVENRPGASGIIAGEACKRSAPDGHTICMMNRSFFFLPYLVANVSFDPVKDFRPVTKLLDLTQVIVAHPSVGASNMKELLAVAKAKPGVLNYASLGPGSGISLLFEWMKKEYGLDMVQVPFKNPTDLVQSTVTGQTSVTMLGTLNFLGQIRAGKVRVLAVSNRMPQVPGVASLSEQGLPFDVSNWFGYFVPAGAGDAVVHRIRDDVARIYAAPAFREKFLIEQALLPVNNTAEEFARSIPAEVAAGAAIIKALGARMD